jgi:ubiquinone/menaquinone biosynthesis C-methylase UbiE
MLLNAVEKLMMNNPVRSAVQRWFEAPRLFELGGPLPGGRVLEVGCGRGVGVELLLERFGAERVDAFDLDPDMVDRARERLARHGDRVRLWTGDVTAIDAPDGTYDAVLDFAIIHHVPRWRDALAEIHRVLRPGGCFYAEEVLAAFIHGALWSRILEHPMDDRFDAATFAAALTEAGFEVRGQSQLWGQFAWFAAIKP